MAWQQPGPAGAAYLSSTDFGFNQANRIRDAAIAVAFHAIPLGGSRIVAIAGTGYKDAIDYLNFYLPDAKYSGFVYTAIVDLLCINAATTIAPKIRNITDGTDAVIGSASSSTTWTEQSLTWTPTVGKQYRLQLLKSDDVYECFGIGYVRITVP